MRNLFQLLQPNDASNLSDPIEELKRTFDICTITSNDFLLIFVHPWGHPCRPHGYRLPEDNVNNLDDNKQRHDAVGGTLSTALHLLAAYNLLSRQNRHIIVEL